VVFLVQPGRNLELVVSGVPRCREGSIRQPDRRQTDRAGSSWDGGSRMRGGELAASCAEAGPLAAVGRWPGPPRRILGRAPHLRLVAVWHVAGIRSLHLTMNGTRKWPAAKSAAPRGLPRPGTAS